MLVFFRNSSRGKPHNKNKGQNPGSLRNNTRQMPARGHFGSNFWAPAANFDEFGPKVWPIWVQIGPMLASWPKQACSVETHQHLSTCGPNWSGLAAGTRNLLQKCLRERFSSIVRLSSQLLSCGPSGRESSIFGACFLDSRRAPRQHFVRQLLCTFRRLATRSLYEIVFFLLRGSRRKNFGQITEISAFPQNI